jgi:HPt (histidine-containing phosphotransfer) domain-containing protein
MSTPTTDPQPLYSEMGADPDFGEIVEMFVDEMPERIEALLAEMQSGNMDELQRLAHQIKGAAGGYGFDPITAPAARLEASVRDGEPESDIQTALDELVGFCSRVRAGAPE